MPTEALRQAAQGCLKPRGTHHKVGAVRLVKECCIVGSTATLGTHTTGHTTTNLTMDDEANDLLGDNYDPMGDNVVVGPPSDFACQRADIVTRSIVRVWYPDIAYALCMDKETGAEVVGYQVRNNDLDCLPQYTPTAWLFTGRPYVAGLLGLPLVNSRPISDRRSPGTRARMMADARLAGWMRRGVATWLTRVQGYT